MDLINDLWEKHGVFFLVAVWPVATAILNIVLRKKTAEEWVAFAEKYPRTAGIIRLLRASGLDPVKVVQATKETVKGEAAKNKDKLSDKQKKVVALAEKIDGEPEATTVDETESKKP